MIRLIFIVEGETEEEFVNTVLRSHFQDHYDYWATSCYKIKATKGGLTKYSYLRKDILKAIKEAQAFVTTMIDFYGLPSDMPGYNIAQQTRNSDRAITVLTKAMADDINASNFLPYLQKHEFEALLFSDGHAFAEYEEDSSIVEKITAIAQQFGDCPETINNHPQTAPSKRLMELYKNASPPLKYDKVFMGTLIAETIGLPTIRQKCPHFNQWLTKLETIIGPPNKG